jgi:hypothetical protein
MKIKEYLTKYYLITLFAIIVFNIIIDVYCSLTSYCTSKIDIMFLNINYFTNPISWILLSAYVEHGYSGRLDLIHHERPCL